MSQILVCAYRSVIFRRKRTESESHSLVSEGLREAIRSYLEMTEGHNHSWDTWAETVCQSERKKSVSQTERRHNNCHASAAAQSNYWKRSSACPHVMFTDCPGIAAGQRHYTVWKWELETLSARGLFLCRLWVCKVVHIIKSVRHLVFSFDLNVSLNIIT